MEHIVQFAISIDDQTIQKRLEENAYDDIINKLMRECKKSLPRKYSDVDWRWLVEDILGVFVENHKDEIIDAAAKNLCESYKRTKAYKEKMAEAMDILKGEN